MVSGFPAYVSGDAEHRLQTIPRFADEQMIFLAEKLRNVLPFSGLWIPPPQPQTTTHRRNARQTDSDFHRRRMLSCGLDAIVLPNLITRRRLRTLLGPGYDRNARSRDLVENHAYVVCGKDRDFLTFIGCRTSFTQVLSLRCNVPPSGFITFARNVGQVC